MTISNDIRILIVNIGRCFIGALTPQKAYLPEFLPEETNL